MLLSGDDLTQISSAQQAQLRKLLPPTGVAAEFSDDSFEVGYVRLQGRTVVCLLNAEERPRTLSFKLPGPCRVTDFWTGEVLGRHEDTFESRAVPKHGARLLICEPVLP
jgi:alpha-galactosidase